MECAQYHGRKGPSTMPGIVHVISDVEMMPTPIHF